MSDDLNDLEQKLAQFRAQETAEQSTEKEEQQNADNMRLGIRAGTELVVSIGAGVFIGLLLDNWLDTKPLFLITFILAGIGAGFMNIYRLTQNIGSSVGFAALHNDEKQAKKTPENKD